jgi:protein-S-isoprenylcysteine O-methyltransferase Ste14
MSAKGADSAGVYFPPPLLYLIPLFLGIWLRHLDPLIQVSPATAALLKRAGVALGLVAAALLLWALITFWRARTAVIPHRTATTLVIRGPYRLTRNPMYLGLTILYIGVSLWAASVWSLLFLPMVIIVMRVAVINREEAYLARRFGDQYRQYQARVRRWI